MWLELAHQRGSLGLRLEVHVFPGEGRKPRSSEGVEAGDLLLLLNLVSEALDFLALHFNDSPRLFLLVQSHGGCHAERIFTGHWEGQSRTNSGLLLDKGKAFSKPAYPLFLPPCPPNIYWGRHPVPDAWDTETSHFMV